jgi:hypothetical protein
MVKTMGFDADSVDNAGPLDGHGKAIPRSTLEVLSKWSAQNRTNGFASIAHEMETIQKRFVEQLGLVNGVAASEAIKRTMPNVKALSIDPSPRYDVDAIKLPAIGPRPEIGLLKSLNRNMIDVTSVLERTAKLDERTAKLDAREGKKNWVIIVLGALTVLLGAASVLNIHIHL